jgi:hypothetical protein
MTTATWILIAMLTPFWWGMGLLVMAVIGDLFPSFRARVSRPLHRLEGIGHVKSSRRVN